MTTTETVAAVQSLIRDAYAQGNMRGHNATVEGYWSECTEDHANEWIAENADRIEAAMPQGEPVAWRSRIVSVERGGEYDEILRVYTPTLTLRFSSVDSANTDPNAKGWKDRDSVAGVIAKPSAQPASAPVESLGRDSDYPECSGDPASCPENEGHGCCMANPAAPPAPVVPVSQNEGPTVKDALRQMVKAARYLQNHVIETRGAKCMDDMDVAINSAERALAAPSPTTKKEDGNG